MGCDIHMYLEYRDPASNLRRYQSFAGKFCVDRDYQMFGLLASVREQYDESLVPKGMPPMEEVGYCAFDDYTMFIMEDADEDNPKYCTQEDADRWIGEGNSEYTDNDRAYITNPDWHTPSWVTLREYTRQLRMYRKHAKGEYRYDDVHDAIVAAMTSLELSGMETRLVFWFDN